MTDGRGAGAPPSWPAAVAAMVESSDRVLSTAAGLTAADVRGASVLPGWTRAHVLTHLARNADGLRNLVRWAETGVETPAYASREVRAADIEAGAGRTPIELLDDLDEASQRLAEALTALDEDARAARVRLADGTELAAHALPSIRVRELEIHHVDLLAGYGPTDWPPAFVQRTLDRLAPVFAARGDIQAHALVSDDGGRWVVGPDTALTLRGPREDLLVWLIGRELPVALATDSDGAGLPPSPQW